MIATGTRQESASFIPAGLCLLIFLQYNDALLEFFKPFPLFNLVSAAMALMIFSTARPSDLRQRFADSWMIFLPVLALIILSAFSSYYAVDEDKAMEDTIRMLKILVMVLIMAYALRRTKDLERAVHGFVLASMVLGGFIILEAIHGQPLLQVERHEETLDLFDGFFRSSGLSMESPPMAATLALCGACISAVMLLRRRAWRAFYVLGFSVSSVAVVVSLTRSATISLVVIVLLLICRLRRRRGFPGVVAATLMVFAISVMLLPPEVWEKLQLAFDPEADQTILRRLSYQIIGWDLFVQHPVFGVGAGNFNDHYASAEYRFVPGRGDEPRPLHNLYLQYLSELGILGFALLLGLIGAVIRALGRVAATADDPELQIMADALLIGFVSGLFQLFFISSNFLFSFWAIVGLTVGVVQLHRGEVSGHRLRPPRRIARARDDLVALE